VGACSSLQALSAAYLDIASYPVGIIAAVVGYVACNDYSGDFLVRVPVSSGIFQILLVNILIVIQIHGAASDDDVTAICHGSFSF
jgi:hypothetical protein